MMMMITIAQRKHKTAPYHQNGSQMRGILKFIILALKHEILLSLCVPGTNMKCHLTYKSKQTNKQTICCSFMVIIIAVCISETPTIHKKLITFEM